MLLRHEAVARLEAGYSTQAVVVFGVRGDDEGNPEQLFVTMPRDLWLDMGEPATITVAIRPGDHLNEGT